MPGKWKLPAALLQPLGSETLAGRTFQFYRFKPETRILKEAFFAVTDGNGRYTYCLWQPPLYVYVGALFFRVLDLPVADANLFRYAHLVLVALMFGGIAMLMRELYTTAWLLGLSLATLLLAASTFSVAASVLVDYNGAPGHVRCGVARLGICARGSRASLPANGSSPTGADFQCGTRHWSSGLDGAAALDVDLPPFSFHSLCTRVRRRVGAVFRRVLVVLRAGHFPSANLFFTTSSVQRFRHLCYLALSRSLSICAGTWGKLAAWPSSSPCSSLPGESCRREFGRIPFPA